MRLRAARWILPGATVAALVSPACMNSFRFEGRDAPASLSGRGIDGTVELTWSAVPDAVGYTVYLSLTSGFDVSETAFVEKTFDESRYQVVWGNEVPDPGPGTPVYAVVTARFRGGKESLPSGEIAASYLTGPFSAAPTMRIRGEADGDDFGWAMAVCDFDADGREDLIVTAPGYSVTIPERGAIYVFRGAPESGLVTTSASLARAGLGNGPNDRLGEAIDCAQAGSPADSYADLLVGSPGYQAGRGGVVVLPGMPPPIALVLVYFEPGQAAGGRAGTSVAWGQLDGDARMDAIVGAPISGQVQVFLGTSGGFLTHSAIQFAGGPSTRFGNSVAAANITAGDVQEVIVGAPFADGVAGVNHGGVLRLISALSTTASLLGTVADGELGATLLRKQSAGGYDDLVASEPGYAGHGRVHVFRGTGAVPNLDPDPREGTLSQGRFGEGLHLPGDVSRDGAEDLLVLTPGAGPAIPTLLTGSGNGLALSSWAAQLPHPGPARAVTSIDVNRDGYRDVAVSSPGDDEGSIALWLSIPPSTPFATAGLPLQVSPNALVRPNGAFFNDTQVGVRYRCTWTLEPDLAAAGPQVLQGCTPATAGNVELSAPGVTGRYQLRLRVEAMDGRWGEAITRVDVDTLD